MTLHGLLKSAYEAGENGILFENFLLVTQNNMPGAAFASDRVMRFALMNIHLIWNSYATLPWGQALYISFNAGEIPTIEQMTVELLDSHYSGLNIHGSLVLFLGEFRSIEKLKDFLSKGIKDA